MPKKWLKEEIGAGPALKSRALEEVKEEEDLDESGEYAYRDREESKFDNPPQMTTAI